MASAATLKVTLITPEDDPRLERTRVERAYLGHPGGSATQPAAAGQVLGKFSHVRLQGLTAAGRK